MRRCRGSSKCHVIRGPGIRAGDAGKSKASTGFPSGDGAIAARNSATRFRRLSLTPQRRLCQLRVGRMAVDLTPSPRVSGRSADSPILHVGTCSSLSLPLSPDPRMMRTTSPGLRRARPLVRNLSPSANSGSSCRANDHCDLRGRLKMQPRCAAQRRETEQNPWIMRGTLAQERRRRRAWQTQCCANC